MKTLKGNLINSSTILALFGTIGLCFFWKHTDGFDWWLLVGIVVLNIIFGLISYQSFHHFQFSGDTLTVKNSIMPTIHKEHLLKDIRNVYVDNVGHLGRALILEFTNGKKKAYGASDCSRDDMEEFAKYLNEQIKKFSR